MKENRSDKFLALVSDSIHKFVGVVCFICCAQFLYSQDKPSINLKYLGCAGWEITQGNTTVLIDPYISRLKLGSGSSISKEDNRKTFTSDDYFESDTSVIDGIITKVDYILVHHSHFDHLSDVPYIAKKTGARVIGTETTCNILEAYGIPKEQLVRVKGGEDYQFENFSVRIIPSLHSALKDKQYFDSRTYSKPPALPLRIKDFVEGGSLMFLLRFDSHSILSAGSMNFIEREIQGLSPDIILPGVNFSRLEIYNYTERLLRATNYPKIVVPAHWDNYRVPYGFSQQKAIEAKIIPFIEEVKEASSDSKVIIPVHLETITIE
ncbi:MAG: L-ascorbate metabolism protein UlaG (beta-lactamase superfamily) [Saprospiraceae bacterium]|jgi:L-ascorbate metabolism protein UlaG (beta-lactamase superfamily)